MGRTNVSYRPPVTAVRQSGGFIQIGTSLNIQSFGSGVQYFKHAASDTKHSDLLILKATTQGQIIAHLQYTKAPKVAPYHQYSIPKLDFELCYPALSMGLHQQAQSIVEMHPMMVCIMYYLSHGGSRELLQ